MPSSLTCNSYFRAHRSRPTQAVSRPRPTSSRLLSLAHFCHVSWRSSRCQRSQPIAPPLATTCTKSGCPRHRQKKKIVDFPVILVFGDPRFGFGIKFTAAGLPSRPPSPTRTNQVSTAHTTPHHQIMATASGADEAVSEAESSREREQLLATAVSFRF